MVRRDGDIPKVPSNRIVVKKIKMTRKRGKTRTRNTATKKPSTAGRGETSSALPKPTKNSPVASFGLPAFRFEVKHSKSGWRNYDTNNGDESSIRREVEDSSSFYPDHDGAEDDIIPSDTLMAIYSLIESDQGLHIPTTNNGSVQIILESQIYSIFDENHASIVNAELLELIQTNKILRMNCHNMSSMAFMRTEDYVKAIWDSHNHEKHPSPANEEIVSWFLAQLHHWTKLSISDSSLEDRWETNRNATKENDTELSDAVRYLLNVQFLIRDPEQNLNSGGAKEGSYFLWLPNWGIVLKTWNKARQQFLTLLAQRKEMSKSNLLQNNRHSRISNNFLLKDLLSMEKIRIVERPFGSFIQLVRDS